VFIGGFGLTLGGSIGWYLGEYLISKIIKKK
jgi:membrane protein YqaA with SNARE-associated domain